MTVGIGTDEHAAHRPHQEAHAKGGRGQQQLAVTGGGWEEQRPDDQHQEREDGEVEELQRVADGGAGDDASAHRRCVQRWAAGRGGDGDRHVFPLMSDPKDSRPVNPDAVSAQSP
ncbi:hypothetical protein D3C71_1781620 [compost metagenome]